MRYAVGVPNVRREFADPNYVVTLAREAESAGWDGCFLWDHICADGNWPVGDPWVMLSAIACSTTRLVLGPLVTPLPRRRPWKVAREAVTLDHLSGGRVRLGVGIGTVAKGEYSCYGEPADDRLHAAMLDEGLEVLCALWSGEPFSFEGTHYRLDGAHFLPLPVQRPRIPIWARASGRIGGHSAAPRGGTASAPSGATARSRRTTIGR